MVILGCRACNKPLSGATVERLFNALLLGKVAIVPDYCPECEANEQRLVVFLKKTEKRMMPR